MATRKADKTSAAKAGGCFMIVFGLPFLIAGAIVFTQALRILLGFKPATEGIGGLIMMMFVALIFGGAGGVFIYIGIRGVRGQWNVGSRPKGKIQETNWQKSKLFPQQKKRTFGPRRGIALKPESTAISSFFVLAFISVFWNGISWTAVVVILRENDGLAKWGPLIFLSIFVLVGLILVYAVFHKFFRVVLVGTSIVEIDIEPMAPGDRARLRVYQKGDFEITSARLELAFRERVTYRQGTRTVTSDRDVHTETLAEVGSCRASRSVPIMETELVIPEWAPHSFEANSNKLQWGVRLHMDIPNRPDVKDLFFFRVKPGR
ncbi:hypothetical protein KQI84_13585 [bacterium]|nr:hypothetical protein [bacterium]